MLYEETIDAEVVALLVALFDSASSYTLISNPDVNF